MNEIIKKLQAKRAELEKRARAIVAAADARADNPGMLTPEEGAECDAITAEMTSIDQNIERRTHLAGAVAAGDLPAGRVTQPATPGAAPVISGVRERLEDDPLRGFRNKADFFRQVRGMAMGGGVGMMSETMRRHLEIARSEGLQVNAAAPATYHNENSLSESGVPLPPEVRQEVFGLVFEGDSLLAQSDQVDTESNSLRAYVDESVPWGTTGIQARWRGEGAGPMTPGKDDALKPRDIRMGELYAFVPVTNEDLEDSPRLQDRLTRKAAERIGWKVDETIIRGDGVDKPLGFMNAGGMISVAKESGQAADTIVAANVAKMYSRLINPSKGVWVANNDTLQQIMQLNLANNLLWTPPSEGFKNAPGGYLLGRPVQFNLHCDTLGDQGDLFFIDPKGYLTIKKASGIDFQTSIHLWFDYGISAFRWTFRINGQPYLNAAVTPPNSAATLSHFVALDARA